MAHADVHALGKILSDRGWAACSSLDMALTTFYQVMVTEEAVARALGMIIQAHSVVRQGTVWNYYHFVHALHIKNEHLQWDLVYRYLDHPEFVVCDSSGLKILFDVWAVACMNKPFPIQILFQPWTNTHGQRTILYHLIYSRGDLLLSVKEALSVTPPVLGDNDIEALALRQRPQAVQLANHPLNSLPLVKALFVLYDMDTNDDVRVFIDRLTLEAPELLLIGCAQFPCTPNTLLHETMLKLLNIFLIGHTNSTLVIVLLWQKSPACLMEGLLTLYRRDPASVSRILDIAQEAKILVYVLKTDVLDFALDLASLAARRQHLNLEKWLMEEFTGNPSFTSVCLDFLESKYTLQVAYSPAQAAISVMHLSVDVVKVFLRVLADRNLTPVEQAKLQQVCQCYADLHPELQAYLTSLLVSKSSTSIAHSHAYTPDTEQLARHCFDRLYKYEITPQELIDIMITCQRSDDMSRYEFYMCLTDTLLDETRFFDQYPDHELLITGEVLGLMVRHRLVEYGRLRLVLKTVLDAISRAGEAKLFPFGLQALMQFADRCVEWPQYLLVLTTVPGLKSYAKLIARFKEQLWALHEQHGLAGGTQQDALRSSSPLHQLSSPSSPIVSAATTSAAMTTSSSSSSSLAARTTPVSELSAGSSGVRTTLMQHLDELTPGNVIHKATAMTALLLSPVAPIGWLSEYMVIHIAATQPSRHDTLAQLLKAMDRPQLLDIITRDTYGTIQQWLKDAQTTPPHHPIAALQPKINALATWLGKITLEKNKPIRHKSLSLKDLIIDAYDHHQLSIVIPFCCNVLSQGATSTVFKPPNPWMVSLLKLMAEVYWVDDLPITLKMNIERLFRDFQLAVIDLEPTTILAMHEQQQSAPQGPSRLDPAEDEVHVGDGGGGRAAAVGVIGSRASAATTTETTDQRGEMDLAPLLYQLQFSAYVQQCIAHHGMIKTLIFRAVANAFLDLVPNVTMTCCNVAVQSTRDFVLRDFAYEPDEKVLQRAAHAMIQPVVAQLAVVTCKEPLGNAITATIVDYLRQVGFDDNAAYDIASSVSHDNLTTICLFVQHFAKQRAVRDIDLSLAQAYASRRAFQKNGDAKDGLFVDPSVKDKLVASIDLPEALKPTRPLTAEQIQVYTSFMEAPTHAAKPADMHDTTWAPADDAHATFALPHASTSSFQSQQQRQQPHQQHQPIQPLQTAQPQVATTPGVVPTPQATLDTKLEQLLVDLDRIIRQAPMETYAQLPPGHEILQITHQATHVMRQANLTTMSLLSFTEKVVYLLYESPATLGREVYANFLNQLLDLSDELAEEVCHWLLYANDERKFNASVTYTLLEHGLLPAADYDTWLAKSIRRASAPVIEFAFQLLRTVCQGPVMRITVFEDFILTIQTLFNLDDDTNESSIRDLTRDLEAQVDSAGNEANGNDNTKSSALKMRLLLAEWVRAYQVVPRPNDTIYTALTRKITDEWHQDDDGTCQFLRLCTQTCLAYHAHWQLDWMKDKVALLIDSYAHLVACLASEAPKPQDEAIENASTASSISQTPSTALISRALSVLTLLMAHAHESEATRFEQVAFYRILTAIYTEIHDNMDPALLLIYSDTLLTLQPLSFPGFAFSWLQLISSRHFVPQLLVPGSQGMRHRWEVYERLLCALLDFLGPLLADECEMRPLPMSVKLFYQGTQRVLVQLLKDFPEFLCHYYQPLIQRIPPSCLQLRNVVLSAFPRNMTLPRPKDTDMPWMPACKQLPTMDLTALAPLLNAGSDLAALLDSYLATPSAQLPTSTTENTENIEDAKSAAENDNDAFNLLMTRLLALMKPLDVANQQGTQLLAALVLYLGHKTMQRNPDFDPNGFALKAFQWLVRHMDDQGRFVLVGCLVDHLRYPSSHTYFFTMVLLHLYEMPAIAESIVRVLLERLLVHRPHPWGVQVLYYKLTTENAFWQQEFVHSSSRIQQLLANTARAMQTAL
ncbi:CCR4-Not complex component, Not1-domain-containing protein [Gongronella butleri]|nr:CCR4-Not complex component, Not1-domain-containing protein [Gongronella butleri]